MDGRISNFQQIASLRRYTLTEGRERGLDVIDCDNGNIRFLLNVSKALDIMQLYHRGQNISFLSKNAFSVRETDFSSRFEGGMLYTCGVDSVDGREGFAVHGSVHNMPAEITRAECNEDGITVEAIIRNTALFGRNMTLYRKIYSKLGTGTVRVEDKLKNEAFTKENYCILYHVNLGYPMLDEGCTIEGDIVSAEPRTALAKENFADRFIITSPEAGREENCYFLKFKCGIISLNNIKLGKSFTLEFSKDTLPCFIEWKSMASGDYALGLEPSTTELDDKFAYSTLDPGEAVDFSISLTVSEK